MSHPLLRLGSRFAGVILGLALTLAVSCVPSDSASTDRKSLIRSTIKRNLHFDLHCFCRTADQRTVAAVRRISTDGDVDALADLLGDTDPAVVAGAMGTLVEFASTALENLRPALTAEQWSDPNVLGNTSIPAVIALRRVAKSGEVNARAAAIDALITIEVSERTWRRGHQRQ